jgi:hypothetical protein
MTSAFFAAADPQLQCQFPVRALAVAPKKLPRSTVAALLSLSPAQGPPRPESQVSLRLHPLSSVSLSAARQPWLRVMSCSARAL